MTRERKTVWDPYAQTDDIVLDTVEEAQAAEYALTQLEAAIQHLPGWLVEETGLQAAIEKLEHARLNEEAS
jgi:hypothetical protein